MTSWNRTAIVAIAIVGSATLADTSELSAQACSLWPSSWSYEDCEYVPSNLRTNARNLINGSYSIGDGPVSGCDLMFEEAKRFIDFQWLDMYTDGVIDGDDPGAASLPATGTGFDWAAIADYAAQSPTWFVEFAWHEGAHALCWGNEGELFNGIQCPESHDDEEGIGQIVEQCRNDTEQEAEDALALSTLRLQDARSTPFTFRIVARTASLGTVLRGEAEVISVADPDEVVLAAIKAAADTLQVADSGLVILDTQYLGDAPRGLTLQPPEIDRIREAHMARVPRAGTVGRAEEALQCSAAVPGRRRHCEMSESGAVLSPELRSLSSGQATVYVSFFRGEDTDDKLPSRGTFVVSLAKEGDGWQVTRLVRFLT